MHEVEAEPQTGVDYLLCALRCQASCRICFDTPLGRCVFSMHCMHCGIVCDALTIQQVVRGTLMSRCQLDLSDCSAILVALTGCILLSLHEFLGPLDDFQAVELALMIHRVAEDFT